MPKCQPVLREAARPTDIKAIQINAIEISNILNRTASWMHQHLYQIKKRDMFTLRTVAGMDKTGGFTLVEMLVTLVIVGMAGAVAFQFAGAATGRGRQPAHLATVLNAEFGLLRAQAMRTGLATRVAFDPENGRFLSSRAGAAPIRTAPLPVVVLPADGAGAPGEIRFLPDGGSSGGRIVIGSPGAGAILAVSTLTGRVQKEELR